jgi:hypothetical protein
MTTWRDVLGCCFVTALGLLVWGRVWMELW